MKAVAHIADYATTGGSAEILSMKNSASVISLDLFAELTGAVYDGLLESIPWQKCLIRLRSELQANYVTLILRPPRAGDHGLMVNVGDVTTEGQISYDSHFYALDPFVGLPSDRMVTINEIIEESRWVESPFYQEFLQPFGVHYIMGADVRTADGGECRLRVCRPRNMPNFAERDKMLCTTLLPHFKRAVQLHGRLDRVESERKLYAGAMDRLMVGTVILDENGHILQTNRMADTILQVGDGMRILNNMPHATHPADNRELQRLIKSALEGQGNARASLIDALSITRSSGRRNLGIVVHSVPPNEWSERVRRPAAVLYIRDPEQKAQAPHDIVRQLFNFTPAETNLAMLLADGLPLEEAALELGIRRNTARAHLRAIFSKTDVTRQTELVRIILNSVATLGVRES
ncbi:helix-turn-helix transcriptional regulator [Herbaspirillum sp. GCM10030257]|uniref:helix-turn-helix transcriptional regulator n=1 Tax=Herbaspirillum sp. GCM10030257 TaxID=3273393 RepID=UPI003612FC2A